MVSEKIKTILRKDSPYFILLIIVLAIITSFKIYIIVKYGARWWSDSYDYYYYGGQILKGDFLSPEAKRTPGYPIFIALSFLIFGMKNNSIAFMQVILSLFSLYLFYAIQRDLGLSNKAIVLNIILFLLGPLSYFDLNVLSESFTVFTALLYLRSVQKYFLIRNKQNAVFTLLTAMLLVLTRPQFIFPIIIVNIYLYYKNYKKYSLIFTACFILFILSYSFGNYLRSNYFGMSSYLGYNIINHTGEYIEDARELNPQLVDIYVNKREEFKKIYSGNQAFAIWGCIDELYKKMNYDFIKLSNELTRISVYLIVTHPVKYLTSFNSAMFKSFLYNDEYRHENYKIKLLSVINIFIFIAGTLFLLLIRSGSIYINYIKIIFFINIISSGMLDIGENFRHIVPLMFILIVAFTTGSYLTRKKVVFEKLSKEKE